MWVSSTFLCLIVVCNLEFLEIGACELLEEYSFTAFQQQKFSLDASIFESSHVYYRES